MIKNLKWSWCWFCNCATVDSYNDEENTCCAAWGNDEEFFKDYKEWVESNPKPERPLKEDIQAWVANYTNPTLTEKEILIQNIFGYQYPTEKEYKKVLAWVKELDFDLIPFEVLLEKCKTTTQ